MRFFFVAGAVFGEVRVSLFVAGAVSLDYDACCSVRAL